MGVPSAPTQAEACLNLGIAQRKLGDFRASLESFDKALRFDPELTRIWINRGLALAALRRLSEALENFDQALQREPRSATALYNRGNVLLEMDRAEEALASYRRLLQHDPNDADALTNSGIVLLRLKRPDEALDALNLALRHRPNSPLALIHRGIALTDLGRYSEALRNYDQPALQGSAHPEVCYRRALAWASLRRFDEAWRDCEFTLQRDPGHVGALFVAGVTSDQLHRDGAVRYFDRLLAREPDHPYARGTRFNVRARNCDWTHGDAEGVIIIDKAMRGTAVDFPFPFLSVSDSAEAQRACAQTFARDKFPAAASPRDRQWQRPHGRIRVAYVSRDLRNHAVSRLMAGIFERHDRGRFEIHAISLMPGREGPFDRRVKAAFDRFYDVSADGDAQICALIRRLDIDVAVDLTGFTEGARTQIFANRAAPVQINYLGFPGTMGTPYMDYMIADRYVVPPHRAMHYEENVVYLPHCFQANDDRREAPAPIPGRLELGLPESGFVWCCMNAAAKINAAMFDIWMRLLHETPHSVLWLLAGTDAMRENLRREAQKRGVSPDRLVFAAHVSYDANIARMRAADLYLDTLPFNAGATASDVLWAGLPLLTCSGNAFAARMAGSLLRTIGLTELATDDLAEYERRALLLARSPESLGRIRAHLDVVRPTTPLFDSERFCRHLESAYAHMTERSHRGDPPEAFSVEADGTVHGGSISRPSHEQ